MPRRESNGIPGRRKAAILLASVGDPATAQILRMLSEDEVHDIVREISLLSNVTNEERKSVLTEYLAKVNHNESAEVGGMQFVTAALVSAFGAETGKRMAERVAKSMGTGQPGIDALRKADPEQLAKVVNNESPQTIALILSHLGINNAAQLLKALPIEIRADVARRMAALEQISPDIIDRIVRTVSKKLKVLGESSFESYGGVRAVAEVLNRVEGSMSEVILGEISVDEPDMGQTIRNLMFVFDDLAKISKDSLRTLLGRVDRNLLTLALKGGNPSIKAHFKSVMSTRAAEMLDEDMQALGPVRMRDVEDAQQKTIALARELQTEGALSLQSNSDEVFVN